ncbi:hypothetical protein EWM64_g730 [Hericium alpestre]|uniref:Uncharacterized protein n=1 Tax=Hericium alpestre TaxID=135208 RepID=A0A4Z0A9R6_9AGAM|nr:hypothetical protein EWM64_g730 [Hericium alpestre]
MQFSNWLARYPEVSTNDLLDEYDFIIVGMKSIPPSEMQLNATLTDGNMSLQEAAQQAVS